MTASASEKAYSVAVSVPPILLADNNTCWQNGRFWRKLWCYNRKSSMETAVTLILPADNGRILNHLLAETIIF
jgi:hypothetical protein